MYETSCTIAVPEDSVDDVSRLLRRAGFDLVLGDLQEIGCSRWRLLRTISRHDSVTDSAGMSQMLTHEVALRRALLAAAADFKILDSDASDLDPKRWWQVLFAATGTSTGMRIRASGLSGVDEQLDALARFLGVPRSSLTASPGSEPDNPMPQSPTAGS